MSHKTLKWLLLFTLLLTLGAVVTLCWPGAKRESVSLNGSVME